MTTIEAAAAGSIAWAAVGLGASVASAWRRGTSRVPGTALGPAWPGVVYAFTRGMSPHAKESASLHPWSYAAGVTYHLGIAAAALHLVATLAHQQLPAAATAVLALMAVAAAVAGGALLLHRGNSPVLRAISAPDDYAANLLVDAWLATAALSIASAAFTPLFLVVTILLGFYAPLGKIRHCVFFLLSRGEFGARLGRRGAIRSHRHGHHRA